MSVQYLGQLVVSFWCHKEATVLQLHLSVLEEIVQHRQYIPLCLLYPLQDEQAAFQSSLYSTLQQERGWEGRRWEEREGKREEMGGEERGGRGRKEWTMIGA